MISSFSTTLFFGYIYIFMRDRVAALENMVYLSIWFAVRKLLRWNIYIF